MASFYNNYYRFYRPYPAHINNHYTPTDKVSSMLTSSEEISSIESSEVSSASSDKNEKSSRGYSFGPINFKNPLFTDIEEPIFEVFGIHLYLDDIIILGLLFFLDQEGVQDELLFISLILLLI